MCRSKVHNLVSIWLPPSIVPCLDILLLTVIMKKVYISVVDCEWKQDGNAWSPAVAASLHGFAGMRIECYNYKMDL